MLKINYITLARYNIKTMLEVRVKTPVFAVIAAPWFVLRMVYSVVASQWGWYMTNRSDLAERLADPHTEAEAIERVQGLAQDRVERGLVGYEVWVEYANECLAYARLRG